MVLMSSKLFVLWNYFGPLATYLEPLYEEGDRNKPSVMIHQSFYCSFQITKRLILHIKVLHMQNKPFRYFKNARMLRVNISVITTSYIFTFFLWCVKVWLIYVKTMTLWQKQSYLSHLLYKYKYEISSAVN